MYELVRDAAPTRVATRSAERYPPTRTRSPLTIDLPGVVDIVPVPGFARAPVAIAILDDGAQLVLNRASDRSVRVAGTFTGFLPRADVAGDWAMITGRDRVSIFRRGNA